MDRKKLKKLMEENDITKLSEKEMSDILERSINSSSEISQNGVKQLIVTIEELSELQKEICKSLRGKTDVLGLTEEIADVYITMEYIKRIYKIDLEDIGRIVTIKLNKLKEQLDKNNK